MPVYMSYIKFNTICLGGYRMNKSNAAETNLINLRLALLVVSFVTVGNILDVVKGTKLLVVALGFTLLGGIYLAILVYFYKRDRSDERFKLISYIGFFILYTYVLFSTHAIGVYVYILPIMYMYFLYFDFKLMSGITWSVIGVNIVRVIWLYTIAKCNTSTELTEYIIAIGSLIVICMNARIATRTSNKFSDEKMSALKEAHEKQQAILNEVLKIGATLDVRSNDIYNIVSVLDHSTVTMSNAMMNMTAGAKDTAGHIENQKGLTSTIQHIIHNTVEASEEMTQISLTTISEMDRGMQIVKDLSEKTAIMNANSDLLYEAMLALKEETNEIGRITNEITGIASQTTILSLNAAIESARAGEAGKGFGVVADEVRQLSNQTTYSASNISKILKGLQERVAQSVEKLDEYRVAHKEQNQLIINTKDIFDRTILNMQEVNKNVTMVSEKIQEILSSNNDIVKSIEEIATTSKNTLLDIEETNKATQLTSEHVEETKQIAEDLLQASESLKQYI